MKVCANGHRQIVYDSRHGCPLCALIKHNNTLHDFIESKGQKLIDELVEYQKASSKKGGIMNKESTIVKTAFIFLHQHGAEWASVDYWIFYCRILDPSWLSAYVYRETYGYNFYEKCIQKGRTKCK